MFKSKEQSEKVQLLNLLLGTSYRTKAFDLKNEDDLIEALIKLTGEYIDMFHFWMSITEVNENFDETIEVFYPEEWISFLDGLTREDDEIAAAYDSINRAENALMALTTRAEDKCIHLWEYCLLNDFPKVKHYFFDENISFAEEVVGAVLYNHISEIIVNLNYDGVVQDSAVNFSKALHEMLVSEERKSEYSE